MATDTTDENVDRLVAALREVPGSSSFESFIEEVADVLHAVRSERNMLAYEKGGHSLWKRYTR